MTEQLAFDPADSETVGPAADATAAATFALPARTTFSPTNLGHSAGLFQPDARRLRSSMSVPTLLGVTATADGALGGLEYDVTTVLCRQLVDAPMLAEKRVRAEARDAGATPSETADAIAAARSEAERSTFVSTTARALCMAIYGYVGGHQRRLMYQALDNLKAVTLTLPGIDVSTGRLDGSALSKTNIISELVVIDQHQRFRAGERDGDYSLARLYGSSKGTATIKIGLAEWLCTAARFFHGRELDFDVQRQLPGLSKTLWLKLEALEFQPVVGSDKCEEEYLLPMDADTLKWLGTNCSRARDNVARVRGQLRRILSVDPTYSSVAVVKDRRDRRRVSHLRIVRVTGEERQARLRAHAALRARALDGVTEASM